MNIIILSEPNDKIVSCGQSQNVYTEVDVKYCKKNNIGYTRRIAGGTTVFLDENQVFYNVILHGYNFPIPTKLLYKKSLGGPLKFYNSIDIKANLGSDNEISVENRKISGIGSCSLEKVGIVVGNIIMEFNYDLCVNTLKFPTPHFKSIFQKQIFESITSIKRELRRDLSKETVYDGLIESFEKDLRISLIEDRLTNWEIKKNKELEKKYQTDKWLNPSSSRSRDQKRFIKIRKNKFIFHYSPMTTDFLIENKIITEIKCDIPISSWLSDLMGINIENIPDSTDILRDLKKELLKSQTLSEN